MRFLIDSQLPPSLAAWLIGRGHDAVRVLDIGLEAAPDPIIWRRAADEVRVLVTKDRDFEEMAIKRSGGPQILWLRIGNVGNKALISGLEPLWFRIEASLAAGEKIVEVLL